MDLSTLLQQLFNGMSMASLYALVAVGITLVFGLTGLVNFAHGELMAVGAYLTYEVAARGGAIFALGVVAAVVGVAALSLALEQGLFRFTLSKPINGFMVSLGLILIIQNLLVEGWTTNPRTVKPAFDTVWEVGDVRLTVQRVLVIVVTLAILIVLYFAFNRTRTGTAIRAAAMDRETVALMGVSVPLMIAIVFIIGGALAGVAGAFAASLFPLTPSLGSQFVLKGFAVALVGGLGNVRGAIGAALVLGLLEATVAALGYGSWVDSAAFGLMIVILVVRPSGLLQGVEASVG